MKVLLVVICLIAIIASYCMCVDDQKRLLVDFDLHQVQLDIQQIKAEFSNVKNEVRTLKTKDTKADIFRYFILPLPIYVNILFIFMYNICIIKISKLVRTKPFWGNLHQILSSLKNWKAK
jgi:hypothetical protein